MVGEKGRSKGRARVEGCTGSRGRGAAVHGTDLDPSALYVASALM